MFKYNFSSPVSLLIIILHTCISEKFANMMITKCIVTAMSRDYTINKNTLIKNKFFYLCIVNNYKDIVHTVSIIVSTLSKISFSVNLLLLDELIKMSKKLLSVLYRKKVM